MSATDLSSFRYCFVVFEAAGVALFFVVSARCLSAGRT